MATIPFPRSPRRYGAAADDAAGSAKRWVLGVWALLMSSAFIWGPIALGIVAYWYFIGRRVNKIESRVGSLFGGGKVQSTWSMLTQPFKNVVNAVKNREDKGGILGFGLFNKG